MDTPEDRYTHGHQDAVLRSHRWRTVANSAGFLTPHLAGARSILDVGCGPGTITVDLARHAPHATVVGLDRSAAVVEEARALGEREGLANLHFLVGDAYDLDAADGLFDVVYAHQLLQHLSDPVAALAQMRGVLVDDGYLAVRDADYGAFAWAPLDPRLDEWRDIYRRVTRRNGAQCDAGRFLPEWVREAGFVSLEVSSSNWTYHDLDDRRWWGGLWAERVLSSDFAAQALEDGVARREDLEDVAQAFREWAEEEDGIFVVVNVEVLAHR